MSRLNPFELNVTGRGEGSHYGHYGHFSVMARAGHVFLNLGHPGALAAVTGRTLTRPMLRDPAETAGPRDLHQWASRCLMAKIALPPAGTLLHSFANHWCSAGLFPKRVPARPRRHLCQPPGTRGGANPLTISTGSCLLATFRLANSVWAQSFLSTR